MAPSNKMTSFNGGTISLGKIPQAISLAEVTQRSLLFQSAPGYGKSAMIYKYGRDKNYKVFAFTGGLINRSNIYGVDFINSDTNSCKHYTADWFSQAMDYNGKVILFLDDFGNASPQEMMILQQILGDRKLGNYDLPIDKFLIIGATNRQNDRANVYSISSAVLSRCCVIEVKLEPSEFLAYAQENFHPSVYSFLNNRKYAISNDSDFLEENQLPADLKGFYGTSNSSNSINPCPRTWAAVSDMLYAQQVNVLAEEFIDIFTNSVSGYVGREITPMFIKSLKGTLNIPSISKLVERLDDKFDYADIISSDNEAISSVAFTIYQEIGKRLVKYKQLRDENKVRKEMTKQGRPYYIYEPLTELTDVLNKIGNTNFKNVNSNVIINDVWDLLIGNMTTPNFLHVVDTLFHLPYLKDFVTTKSNIKSHL